MVAWEGMQVASRAACGPLLPGSKDVRNQSYNCKELNSARNQGA